MARIVTTVRCNCALPGWNGAPAYAGLDEMAMFVTCTSALPALKAGIDEKAERMLCLALEVCRDHTQQARQQQQFPDLELAAAWAQVSFAIMQRKGVGAAAINVGVVEAGVAALHTMSPHEWYAICVHLCALAVSGTYFQRLLTRLVGVHAGSAGERREACQRNPSSSCTGILLSRTTPVSRSCSSIPG